MMEVSLGGHLPPVYDIESSLFIKSTLICSFLAGVVFILQLVETIPGSNIWTGVGFTLYPVVRLKIGGSTKTDIVYLCSVIIPISGVMAYGAQMPIGYPDVHAHLEMIRTSWDGRFLSTSPDEPSFDFIGLYIFTVSLAQLFNLDITTVAQYLPIIFMSITVVLYFSLFSRNYLASKFALLATLAFSLQYGVFRFGVEFRTLGLALPLFVLLLHLATSNERSKSLRHIYISIIITSVFVITHFSSILMLITALVGITFIDQIYGDKSHARFILLISVLFLFVYMAYIGGGFISTVQSLFFQSLGPIFFFESSVGGGDPSGGTASTGLVRWLVRLVFLISATIVGWRWLTGQRDKDTAVLFALCGIFGILSLLPLLGIEIILNPGRFMTFFAIPYGIIFAAGLKWETNKKWRSLSYVSLILGICILLFFSPLATIPSDVIGATEPVRDSNFGQEPAYTLNIQDIAASRFTSENDIAVSNVDEIPWGYYRWSATYDRQGYELQYNSCEPAIYSNGKVFIC